MAIRENLDELMERKMDRGEFLKLAAVAVAGFIGIARFIGALNTTKTQSEGYGAGTYGGPTDRANFLDKLK